jgi:WD40 repeat protein
MSIMEGIAMNENARRLKTKMAYILVSVILAGFLPLGLGGQAQAAGGSPGNVANASFEDLTESGFILGWTRLYGTASSIRSSTDYAFDGVRSMRMEDTSTRTGIAAMSSYVPVTAGNRYVASAKLRGSGTIGIWIRFFDKNDVKVGEKSAYFASGSEWQTIMAAEIAPEGAVKAAVVFSVTNANKALSYVDAVTFGMHNIGKFEKLGPQVVALTNLDSAVGTENGKPVYYAVFSGGGATPTSFAVIDPITHKTLKSIPIPGVDGSWAVTVATDGNVYIGAHKNGRLYQYVPGSEQLTDLGRLGTETHIWAVAAGPDGKVYAGTYPTGRVFEYDPATKQTTDFGPMHPTEKYVRSLAYDFATDTLYAGVGGSRAYLYKLKPGQPGTPEELLHRLIPEDHGNYIFTYSLEAVGGKLYARLTNGDHLLVLDTATETVDYFNPAEGIKMSTPGLAQLPGDSRFAYFSGDGALYRYDTASRSVQTVLKPGEGLNFQDGRFYKLSDPEWPGYTLVSSGGGGKYMLYNLETGRVSHHAADHPGAPAEIRSVAQGPDGNIYTSGYISGFAWFDALTGQASRTMPFGQVEGMVRMGDKLYIGNYSGARIYEYDPFVPWQTNINPRKLIELKDQGQDRPFALVGVPETGTLFIGTVPDYNSLKGSLTAYDVQTGKSQTVVDVVADQGIVSLLYHDGLLYGGTTIYGGLGTSGPTQTAGKLFIFDPKTMTKLDEIAVSPADARVVSGLHLGPDGLIWGVAEQYLFAFDPVSRTFAYKEKQFKSYGTSTVWADASIVTASDGNLYGTAGNVLFAVDPATRQFFRLATGARYLAQDAAGHLYYSNDTDLWRYTLPTPKELQAADLSKIGQEDEAIRFAPSDFKLADDQAVTKIRFVTKPTVGRLLFDNQSVALGQELPADRLDRLAFVPDANWSGTAGFIWQGSDGQAYSLPAKAVLNVSPVNDAPVAYDVAYSTDADIPLSGVLTGDDVEGDVLSFELDRPPSKGTVTISVYADARNKANFLYVPKSGETGDDSFAFTASDGKLRSSPAAVQVTVVPRDIADLSRLSISTGELTPEFAPSLLTYRAVVPHEADRITVTGSVYDPYASMMVNGIPLASGSESSPIPLPVGETVIPIEVTAQDGIHRKQYTLIVTRMPSSVADLIGIEVSAGELAPIFSPGHYSYDIEVEPEVDSVVFTARALDPAAKLFINGRAYDSGKPSDPIGLAFGTNWVTIDVEAQDGVTRKAYIVQIYRHQHPDNGDYPDSGDSDGETGGEQDGGKGSGGGSHNPGGIGDGSLTNGGRNGSGNGSPVTGENVVRVGADGESVDAEALKQALSAQASLIVQIENAARLPAGLLKSAGEVEFVIRSAAGEFIVQPAKLPIADWAAALGANVSDTQLRFRIEPASARTRELIRESAERLGGEVLSEAYEFRMELIADDGRKLELYDFENLYVERTIHLNGRSAGDRFVARFDPAAGALRFVPSVVEGGKATFWRTGNSVYVVMKAVKGRFADTESHWANDSIARLSGRLIVNGVSDNRFEPERTVTRAEFAAMLNRGLGIAVQASGETRFGDVGDGDWFRGEVAAAAQAGLLSGYEDGSFRPSRSISRAEAAVMAVRALEKSGVNPIADMSDARRTLSSFADSGEAGWAADALAAAVQAGLLQGSGEGRLKPNDPIKRAEAAVLVERILLRAGFLPR